MLASLASLCLSVVGSDSLAVDATLPADVEFLEDAEAEITLKVSLPDGWSVPERTGGASVRVRTPESVELERPWTVSRLVKLGEETAIPLWMYDDAGPEDVIGVDVLLYATPEGEDVARFVDARVELPVRPGGVARPAAPATPSPWSAEYAPPSSLDSDRVHLEPLAPHHVDLDFAALMGSREHLHRTLGWGDWPRDDFTVEENLGDLERHWKEYVERDGYAYTVLTPDRSECIGCVYFVKVPGGGDTTGGLAYWVVEDRLDEGLDEHLLRTLLDWVGRDWNFERVVLPTHPANERGRRLARAAGLTADEAGAGPLSRGEGGPTVFVWSRPTADDGD